STNHSLMKRTPRSWTVRSTYARLACSSSVAVSTVMTQARLPPVPASVFGPVSKPCCPTRLFTQRSSERPRRENARAHPWPPMEPELRTLCPYCGVGCGLVVRTEGDRVTHVTGDSHYPVTRGRPCRKPLALPAAVHANDRALTPLRRPQRDS